jgi:hypothetical protein
MHIGEAGIEEPMRVYMSFVKRSQREHWFTDHPSGARKITRLTLTTPTPLRSIASQKIIEMEFLHPELERHLCSKLNWMVSRQSTWISGHVCRLSFNSEL